MNPLPARLLVITDRHQAGRPLEAVVASCLEGGARWVLFRDKDLAPAQRRTLAERVAAAVRSVPQAKLGVSADIGLAEAIGADGVHLQALKDVSQARRRLGARSVIGFSAHRPEEARPALAAGADYVTLSPVFLTASKPGYGPALGTTAVTAAARSGLQVLALGGVTPGTAGACLVAGAAGLAVMGEAMRAADPAALVRSLLDCFAAEAKFSMGAKGGAAPAA